MTTPIDIVRHVEALIGHALSRDEGPQHGDANRPVKGVTVAWMASPDAIRAAGQAGHDLLIAHESLYHPYDVVILPNPPEGWQEWKVNKQRRSLLEEYGLAFLRLHFSVDEICIFDSFVELLGLNKPVHADGFVRVYEIPPVRLMDLVRRVKERVGMAHVRVAHAGNPNRIVHRVGLPWGGLGLFVNVGYQQQLVEQGCDVLIAGESDNLGFRFAAECDIPMIETSHEISENPGLRKFTGILAGAFPGVAFRFYENECVWRVE